MKESNVKPIKTSVGDSIYLFWEAKMVMETESTILMNSTDRYYYEKVSTKQKQTEGERLSNFIIDPLFVMEDSNKKVRYILKFISSDYSKVIEIDGETFAINCVWQNKSAELCKGKMQSPALNFCA
jgi:hypothetical protein